MNQARNTPSGTLYSIERGVIPKMNRTILLVFMLLILILPAGCCGEDGITLFAVNVRKADCLLLQSGQDIYMIDTGAP